MTVLGESQLHVDILVVGGTPSGCAAAIAAARSRKYVCLLEPTQVLGGALSNGVSTVDTGSLQSLTGIFAEFLQGIDDYYLAQNPIDPAYCNPSDRRHFEPHVSAKVWAELVRHTEGIQVIYGAVATDVVMDGKRVRGVLWEPTTHSMGELVENSPANKVTADVVIDATYEADVAAWAGVPFSLGREARSAEEPHAGVIYTTYRGGGSSTAPGKYPPQTILPGSTGEADARTMGSNCRLTCKIYDETGDDAPHRLKSPPDNYDPSRYPSKRRKTLPRAEVPNGKIQLNVPNNLIAPVRDYILAHPRNRGPIRKKFVDFALGYVYFLQTEGGHPNFGLADDEYVDNHRIPYQIYPREGRRIKALDSINESNINPFLKGDGVRPPLLRDSIAIGDYQMDSKECRDERDSNNPLPEGAHFFSEIRAPFQVPFGCIVPGNVIGLLVPVAVSATHTAFTAVRMEPVWTALGQAAGEAAVLMIDRGIQATQLHIDDLQASLIKGGSHLTYFTDVPTDHRYFPAIQWAALRGVIPLDEDWQFTPDEPLSTGEFAEMITKCFNIPISVTGKHFKKIGPLHPYFKYLETLYDTGTRHDIEVYEGTKYGALDNYDPDKPLRIEDAVKIVVNVWKALHAPTLSHPVAKIIATMNAHDYARRGEFSNLLYHMVK